MTNHTANRERRIQAPPTQQFQPADRIDIAELKRRNPIEFMAASYGVKLVQRGRLLVGLCPFHKERTPSFTVDPAKGRWRCFGRCSLDGRWRDVIDFVGMMTNGPAWNAQNRDMFRAAVASLAVSPSHSTPSAASGRWAGAPGPNGEAGTLVASTVRGPEVEPALPRISLTPDVIYLLGKTSRMYVASLRVLGSGPGTPWAYLRSRGFTDEIIGRYRLGYCPGRGRNVLLEAVRQIGFPVELARAMRLLDEARDDREFMRGRIVFPCLDGEGRVVHLAGRKWASFIHPRAPKYLSLYGLPKPLYGVAQIKPGGEPVLFTESLPDWLTLLQWGLDAICNLGTGLTPAHADVLRRLGRPLVYVSQNDENGAGLEAVLAWQEMVGQGAVVLLPRGVKDVNEMAMAGRRAEFLVSLDHATMSRDES